MPLGKVTNRHQGQLLVKWSLTSKGIKTTPQKGAGNGPWQWPQWPWCYSLRILKGTHFQGHFKRAA